MGTKGYPQVIKQALLTILPPAISLPVYIIRADKNKPLHETGSAMLELINHCRSLSIIYNFSFHKTIKRTIFESVTSPTSVLRLIE